MKNKFLLFVLAALSISSLVACASGSNDEKKEDPTPVDPAPVDPGTDPSDEPVDPVDPGTDPVDPEEEEDEPDVEPEPIYPEGTYHRFSFSTTVFTDKKNNYFTMYCDVPFSALSFEEAGTTFSKSLALASFGFVSSASNKTKINAAFEDFGFDNIYNSEDYDLAETKDTTCFTIGHKQIDGVDIIGLSIQGLGYSLPWASNFDIGSSGNHTGFQAGATKVLMGLAQYLIKYPDTNNRKIWISSYSRSSAIANILAANLIDNGLVKEENLYAYLFATPRGIDVSNKKEYKSIFNIMSANDLVTYVAPEIYGLKRVGIDICIDDEKADEIVKAYNKRLVLSPFTELKDSYTNESELIKYLFDTLTTKSSKEDVHDLSTRENFATYYQDDIGYLISLILSLKPEVLSKIVEEFGKLTDLEKAMLIKEDGLYLFLKKVFDEQKEQYDDEQLKSSTNNLINILQVAPSLVSFAMKEEVQKSVLRVVQFHTPEVVLPLLLNYIK